MTVIGIYRETKTKEILQTKQHFLLQNFVWVKQVVVLRGLNTPCGLLNVLVRIKSTFIDYSYFKGN